MENKEKGSEGNSTRTRETNDSHGKGRPPPIVLTSEVNLISLQRELKIVVRREFFWSTATETGSQLKVWWTITPQKFPH
jgi:hypothetical protein